ncbi:DNA recombination protein RmuC [Pseudomonas kilonensis]
MAVFTIYFFCSANPTIAPGQSRDMSILVHSHTSFHSVRLQTKLPFQPTPCRTGGRFLIVKQLWSFEDRNKHTVELASRAQRFYEKLHDFLTSMLAVGNQLDKAKDTYEKGIRPAKSSTQPHNAKTWCALKFKWAPVLAF